MSHLVSHLRHKNVHYIRLIISSHLVTRSLHFFVTSCQAHLVTRWSHGSRVIPVNLVRRRADVLASATDLQLLLVVGHHEAEERHENHEP